jgi:hypothetical protein
MTRFQKLNVVAVILSLVCCTRRSVPSAQASIDSGAVPEAAASVIVVPPPPIPVPRHVLIVGDSEACATGRYAKDAVKQFNDDHGQPHDTIDVECKGGTQVRYWGKEGHLRDALSKHPNPDNIVIFLGTNHYTETKAPDVSIVLDLVKQSGARCTWVGNTAVNGKKWKINKLMRDAVTPTCDYFDTEAANIALPDGVHPWGDGAIKWIKLVWVTIPTKYEN